MNEAEKELLKRKGIGVAVWSEMLRGSIHNAQEEVNDLRGCLDPETRAFAWAKRCEDSLSLAAEYLEQILRDPRGKQRKQRPMTDVPELPSNIGKIGSVPAEHAPTSKKGR